MITISEYKGQAVGVFGLGKAGKAAIDSLVAGGAKVFAWDDNQSAAASWQRLVNDEKFSGRCPLTTANYTEWPWTDMKALVLSPGVPLTHPKPHPVVVEAQKHNCPVIGDIELLCRAQPKAKYIAITGTNGKSTTTTLIGHILKSCGVKCEVGGNLGTPALALAPLGADGVYVLEVSSYQLDLVKTTRFNVAVWLNITPDHIDRHGDIQGYIKAKKHIFERQQAGDVAVIAVDDEYSQEVASGQLQVTSKVKLVQISSQHMLKQGVYVKDGYLYDVTDHWPLATGHNISTIATLTGRHNWQNAAAAYAAARAIGLPPDAIYKAMKTFAGLRHRLQLVATINGVRFINDSKATNADATSNALAPYEHIYWILGGKAKAGGIETLGGYFAKIAHAFLIGEAEAEFARTLDGKVAYSRCGDLAKALQAAAKLAFAEGKKDAVVLLSPACASFDQWKSFEQRGDAFCDLVTSGQWSVASEDNKTGHSGDKDAR